MAITDDLKDLLVDTVTWSPLTGRDQYGVPTYGSGTSYSARVVRKHRLVRDAQGAQVVSTAHAWLDGVPAIDPEDKVALSDGTTPTVISVERYPDEGGAAFTKVFFL